MITVTLHYRTGCKSSRPRNHGSNYYLQIEGSSPEEVLARFLNAVENSVGVVISRVIGVGNPEEFSSELLQHLKLQREINELTQQYLVAESKAKKAQEWLDNMKSTAIAKKTDVRINRKKVKELTDKISENINKRRKLNIYSRGDEVNSQDIPK